MLAVRSGASMSVSAAPEPGILATHSSLAQRGTAHAYTGRRHESIVIFGNEDGGRPDYNRRPPPKTRDEERLDWVGLGRATTPTSHVTH